jgi:hypothetical protein
MNYPKSISNKNEAKEIVESLLKDLNQLPTVAEGINVSISQKGECLIFKVADVYGKAYIFEVEKDTGGLKFKANKKEKGK